MGVFDEIKTGLEQAIAYEKGELKAKKTVFGIAPVNVFTPGEIKEIRKNTGLTHNVINLRKTYKSRHPPLFSSENSGGCLFVSGMPVAWRGRDVTRSAGIYTDLLRKPPQNVRL